MNLNLWRKPKIRFKLNLNLQFDRIEPSAPLAPEIFHYSLLAVHLHLLYYFTLRVHVYLFASFERVTSPNPNLFVYLNASRGILLKINIVKFSLNLMLYLIAMSKLDLDTNLHIHTYIYLWIPQIGIAHKRRSTNNKWLVAPFALALLTRLSARRKLEVLKKRNGISYRLF